MLPVPTVYTPDTESIGGSLVASALVALIPLTTFFVLLGLLRLKAWMAGLGALVAAVVVAVLGFGMPAHLALLSATQGGVYGLFPIMWIVVCAVWLYQLTVVSGRFDDLRAVFDLVGGGDRRIQAMLIAFCFGGLLEALAGFGAPVAITGTMLLSLGIVPLRAAMAVLVANTAPVAFGAMAIPITTAAGLTNIPGHDIAAIVGRQTPVLAAFVPLLLLVLVDGRRGLRQCWPIALVTGLAFAVLQFLTSNFFTYELTDIVAALGGLAAAVLMLRFWRPVVPESEATRLEVSPHGALTGSRIFWAV
ncbi:MAG TPA: L-lactate permease, partial [Cellulomonas sp.]